MGRQLASFDDITYTYNENGIRTGKAVNGITTKYYLNGTDIIEQSDGTTTLHFYYDSSNELVGFNYADADYFYVKNQYGDITDITNSEGEIVATYSYDPWGQVLSVTGSNVEIGELNPFRYRGYYYDSDIEMYYLQSRYYNPKTCRFINCDDVNFIGITESEVSYNPFAYCENNPVNYIDNDGRAAVATAITVSVVYKVIKVVLAGLLVMCSIAILKKSGLLDSLSNSLYNYVKSVGNIAKSSIDLLKQEVNRVVKKALNKAKNFKVARHHIVAQSAYGAFYTRVIWVYNCGFSINDYRNLVLLNVNFHTSLHTEVYYSAVHQIIEKAYNKSGKEGVLLAIALIKSILATASYVATK